MINGRFLCSILYGSMPFSFPWYKWGVISTDVFPQGEKWEKTITPPSNSNKNEKTVLETPTHLSKTACLIWQCHENVIAFQKDLFERTGL